MHARQSRGAALLEALVAVLILSGGMFGNLRMLNEATVQLGSNLYRQHALQLNASVIGILTQLPPGTFSAGIDAVSHDCSGIKVCTSSEIYADSLYRWHKLISEIFPEGTGEVLSRTTGSVTTVEFQISWRAGTESPSSFSSLALPVPL